MKRLKFSFYSEEAALSFQTYCWKFAKVITTQRIGKDVVIEALDSLNTRYLALDADKWSGTLVKEW